MRVDVTIPYQFLARNKGARKDRTGYGLATATVEIPTHVGPAPLVGRFGMPGRFDALRESGALAPDTKESGLKAMFSDIDGRPRSVLFFDNDFWVEVGSTDDIQSRLEQRQTQALDPFAVMRGDVYLFNSRHDSIEDPDALRASGHIKTIVHSRLAEFKATAADRARQDLRIVDGLVVMRAAEPVVAAMKHTNHNRNDQTAYEIVVVPASDRTSTGFTFIEDVGRIATFKAVPLHRKEELVHQANEEADEVAQKGGKRIEERVSGGWRTRYRKRKVEVKFDIEATVLDRTVVEIARPDLLAFDDFAQKANSASWALSHDNRVYLRHMSKQTGLALLRLADAREASRGIVTPRLVRCTREAAESLLDGEALSKPSRAPGRWAVDVHNHHSIDEESGGMATLKSTAGEFLDALEMRVPGRDWFDLAFDAAADFRDGFAIGEICTLTDARSAAAALGAPEISDIALAAARGDGHLIGVQRDKVFHGVLHVTGPADAPVVEQVFARAGFEEMVLKAAEPLLDRILSEASVEADLDLGFEPQLFTAA